MSPLRANKDYFAPCNTPYSTRLNQRAMMVPLPLSLELVVWQILLQPSILREDHLLHIPEAQTV